MECTCNVCGMGVKDLKCSKCEADLKPNTIEKDGNKIKVAECPNGCGKIKSPVCCNHDMECKV